MPNPLISQGSLNRLRGSVTWASFSGLNVTAPYLGRGGIAITFQGDVVPYVETLTGAITSPNPFVQIEMVMNLLKPQALANAYKNQMESNAVIGDCSVRPDVSTGIGIYEFINCSIKRVSPLSFNGENADFSIVIGGYYYVNNSLFG